MLYAGVIAAALVTPIAAQAQGGIPGGFNYGAQEGFRVAGPLGAVVGAPVGGVVGGIQGMLGVGYAYEAPPPPRAPHRYRVRHHRKHHYAR
jgi:hypothetical protein